MRTAVDSSALLLNLRRQPGWEEWRNVLTRAASEGALVVSPVVFAECSLGFSSVNEALRQFEMLGLDYDPITPESAWLAGQTFLKCRKQKGIREHLLPDFLVAAHAATQADQMAATDRGYLRAYFPQLQILKP